MLAPDGRRRVGRTGRARDRYYFPETMGSGAAFLDADADGWQDVLFVNSTNWPGTVDGTSRSYRGPEVYKGHSPALFRNRGDGRFEDVTHRAGLFDSTTKGLGVALLDYDDDGWLDLFAANDLQPNRLYRNNRDGTFTNVGTRAGSVRIALSR